MPYEDLRAFIRALEHEGEIRTVDRANWDLEIGTIAELNYEREGPALLFDGIEGYPTGYRILTNALDSLPRALLALDLPPTLGVDSALAALKEKVDSYRPVPPNEVSTAPLLENVATGEDIDLWKFPTPRWHEHDGGRYIGTGCLVIQRDPDSGEVHGATYRVMIHDRVTTGLYMGPRSQGIAIARKWWAQGKASPVAVVFGMEPVTWLPGTTVLPKKRGAFYEFIGHLRGAPVDVIPEEVTGLPVPATSEIVISGEISPTDVEVRDEGPFGEFTGYYASGVVPGPVMRVSALYHRDDPIILGMPPVRYRAAGSSHFGIPNGANTDAEHIRAAGVPGVIDTWRLAVPGFVVVQIRQQYPGHAMKAGLAALRGFITRFVVVVDEDINPRDPEDVLWAIATRCDPATTINIVSGLPSSELDPRLSPDRKKRGDLTCSCAVIDACKPYEWIKEFPVSNAASPELRRRVREKWGELFPND